MAIFPEKVPWVLSTPSTRIAAKVGEATHALGKAGETQASSTQQQATSLESAAILTADELKALQSLRSLQSLNMQLTEEMSQQLEVLQAKEAVASSSKALTHGHLNRLHKLKNQVSTSATKIVDLDKEWTKFATATMTKVKEHATLYQKCRADLLEIHNQKIAELMEVKKEMSVASASLLGGAQTSMETPEVPNIAESLQSFQDAMTEGGMVGAIDLTALPEDDDEMEEMEQGDDRSKPVVKALRPFRGSPSPTKVATHHLKVKQEAKDAKKDEK